MHKPHNDHPLPQAETTCGSLLQELQVQTNFLCNFNEYLVNFGEILIVCLRLFFETR